MRSSGRETPARAGRRRPLPDTRRPRVQDRRIARTHRALRDALVALILERGWDRVNVRDVCERADVGRSTFYTHFDDKEQLLASSLDQLRQHLRAGAPRGQPLAFFAGLVAHVDEMRPLFRAIVGRRSGQAVQHRFRQVVLELVREDLAAIAPAGPARDAAAHCVTGSLFELLTWWIDGGGTGDAARVTELALRFTSPVVQALRRP